MRTADLILGLATLALAGIVIVIGLGKTPAFNLQARGETVYGDWQVDNLSAMYDPADYYFQLGRSFLLADVLFSAETEARDEIATPEVALARAERARELLTASLAHAPGNAHAWADLAMAQMMLGDVVAANSAMARSWALAAHNRVLAEQRLTFLQVIEIMQDYGVDSATPAQLAAGERDVRVLHQVRPWLLDRLAADSPMIAGLVDQIERNGGGAD